MTKKVNKDGLTTNEKRGSVVRWVRMPQHLDGELRRTMVRESRESFSNMIVRACQDYVDRNLYVEQPKKEALK